MSTPTRKLADLLLPEGLESFVAQRRIDKRSWRLIARDIWEATGGELDLTYETLRAWFPDDRDEKKAAS